MIATQNTQPVRRRYHRPPAVPDLNKLPDHALLTQAQFRLLSGFSLPTLKKWRREGAGPRVTIVEGLPRYQARDVREWLDKGRAE